MRTASPFVLLACAALLAGCNSLGPQAVRRAPFEYNEALVRARNEQLLLNLVRLRYRDTPYFLQPTSLSTQYELQGGASLGLTVVEGGGGDASAGTGITVSERPTVTWTPLQGEDFVKELLSPIPLETVMLLPQAGWSIDRVLRLTVQSLNGLPNAPSASGPTPGYTPFYEDFQDVTCALRRLQVRGRLELVAREVERGAGADPGSAAEPAVEYLLRLLPPGGGAPRRTRPLPEGACHRPPATGDDDGDPDLVAERLASRWVARNGVEELRLRSAYEAPEGELAVLTRSFLGALYYLSQGVEVPPGHLERGLVTPTLASAPAPGAAPRDWARELTEGLFRVRAAPSRKDLPPDAFVQVHYQGT
ncbi:MAG TPA: hypothetical protein VLF66_05430, partial [Thermoanaerobaculia bacterium]|nr:hypothetical protein [Thermoanaerobaculia bacterium]